MGDGDFRTERLEDILHNIGAEPLAVFREKTTLYVGRDYYVTTRHDGESLIHHFVLSGEGIGSLRGEYGDGQLYRISVMLRNNLRNLRHEAAQNEAARFDRILAHLKSL